MKRYLYIFTIVLLISCYNNAYEVQPCELASLEEVRYADHVYPILGRSCAITGCHTTGFENGNFNDFEEVKEKAETGWLEFMIVTDQMPHGATHGPRNLTDCEISIIKRWINDGAQNN